MSDLTGAKCGEWHPLEWVSEGYAICEVPAGVHWFAWRLATPVVGTWRADQIIGGDGAGIEAWVSGGLASKESALAFIQADIDAHRARPFDEERERGRLMEVAR
jgi:hypothetical protein